MAHKNADGNGSCGCGHIGKNGQPEPHVGRDIGKAPLTTHGLNDATLLKVRVREYWTQYPRANIGIAIPRGHFVLDIDILKGGFESLAKLQNDLDIDLPDTWIVLTGSGGNHYWYLTDKEIRNAENVGGYQGIDIRGVGGYVLAPPSLHKCGKRYETNWAYPGPVTKAPDKLIELCLKKPYQPQNGVSSQPVPEGQQIPDGQQNRWLFNRACACRRQGDTEDMIITQLRTLLTRCPQNPNDPFTEQHLRNIAHSACKYQPQAQVEQGFRGGVQL